jgi:hypothetical protein
VPGDTDADRYSYCLAYQQFEYAPADPIAEQCTWTLLRYRRVHRVWMAGTGHLDDWLDEYRVDRALARAAHPEFADGFPAYDDRSPAPELAFVSWWMEGRTPAIDVDGARGMLDEVLREETALGRPPRAGAPVRWSPEFRRRHPVPLFDRLLVTLAGGTSSQFLRTGGEEALVDWIFAQPADSVTIEGLFRASYRLHDGDLYLTLATAENVLSRYFLSEERGALALHDRLRPIVNSWDDRGDQFGGWYHLFGTMLYAYAEGGAKGAFVGWFEAFGSRFSNRPGEVELQEGHLNQAGAKLGAHLRNRVRHPITDPTPHPQALLEASYLCRDEFAARFSATAPSAGVGPPPYTPPSGPRPAD